MQANFSKNSTVLGVKVSYALAIYAILSLSLSPSDIGNKKALANFYADKG